MRFYRLPLISLALLLTACADTPEQPAPPPPTLVDLQINSAKLINPDADGKASPVVLRVYELREQTGFVGADFFALFDKEQATLAADLVRKQELVVRPGENITVKIEPDSDTRMLGFFAAFRKLDNASWRSMAILTVHQNNLVELKLDGNKMTASITATPPEPPPEED